MNATVPMPRPDDVIATVRNGDDMVEAFRKIKELLGLSNAHTDELAGIVEGHTDKLLGPTRAKNIGPLTFTAFCWTFGVKFEMKIDLDQAAVMAQYWDDRQRKAHNVRPEPNRISKKIIERAKPLILKEAGRAGGLARASKLTATLRSDSARKAGQARMQSVTKEQRSAMNRKGWETRRRAKALVLIDQQ